MIQILNNRGRLPLRHKMPISAGCLYNLNNIYYTAIQRKYKAEYKVTKVHFHTIKSLIVVATYITIVIINIYNKTSL